MGYRTLRYGIFVAGFLLAGMSFLVCWGNALAMEGWSESVEKLGILGVLGGSIIAGFGIMFGVVMSRRFVSLAVVVAGGFAGAVGGWLLGSLLFPRLAWTAAVCLTPLGMWLGFLTGADEAV